MHCPISKSLYPFLWVLLSQLIFGAASTGVLLDSPPHSCAPGFLVPLCWADLWTWEWWEWRGKGGVCGSGVQGGEDGAVEKVEREGICHSSCLLPGARCSLLWLTRFLGVISIFQGCWFIPGWMIYGKLGNSSFISYKQSKYLLQKIRLEDNHTSGHSSVKIYYVLGLVPF